MRPLPFSCSLAILAIAAGCQSVSRPTQPTPAPAPAPSRTYERGIVPRPAPPLPAVPAVDGPLVPSVVFPSANQTIPVRDSNFIFGSIGSGRASLTINGTPVTVAPNGTFLAYLPVPTQTSPRYTLFARRDADTASLVVPVRVLPPRPDLSLSGHLVVDSSSVSPRGAFFVLREEDPLRVSVRAPVNAVAWVSAAEHTFPLLNTSGNLFATDLTAGELHANGTLVVARGPDTVRFALTRPEIAQRPTFVALGDLAAQADTDAVVIGRSTPGGTYKWMFIPGTIVQETGRVGDNVRVRLDSQLEVWVDSVSVRPLAPNFPSPRRVVGSMSLVPAKEWVDVVMPVQTPPPFLIEQQRDRIVLTLYGTQASPEIIKFLQNDSLVRMINWVPEASDRVRLSLELTRAPFGYLAMYDPARGFILRLRRPPRVSVARPLDGLTITVDPGHPPGGAIGPTLLSEPAAVLPVAVQVRTMLEQRGARVIMTRTNLDPVDLHLRSVIARQTDSYALVSIHLNAFGDGVNPFPNVGTSTLFFHPQSEPLARLVQAGMMREMGLRDLGIHYQNIAIGRTTWMPAVICEGAFLMVPDQENAIKTPEFQERYARGVVDGIEAYFRTLAR